MTSSNRRTLPRGLWLLGVAPLLAFSLVPSMGRAATVAPTSAANATTVTKTAAHPASAHGTQRPAHTANTGSPFIQTRPGHTTLNCAAAAALCTEVHDPESTFGEGVYVGHDEPSALFYSSKPGSAANMSYDLTLPSDPGNPPAYGAANPLNSYNMMLHPAFWFGMAMCDTQSYPQQRTFTGSPNNPNYTDPSLCPPATDANVTPDTQAGLSSHAGVAYMEMQFYPPGDNHQPTATNPCFVGQSPGNTQWCAALNIDSLSEDPVNGTQLNATCRGSVGVEYVNFGIVTTTGTPPGPADPWDSTQQTYDGDPTMTNPTFFMNSGDQLQVSFNDIPDSAPGPNGSGLQVTIHDVTTNTTGRMVASARNQFGMIKKDPTGTTCTPIPYNFHPMYSTSSKQGRVIWAAHTYNIAFADEIGHFDYCFGIPASPVGPLNCSGGEGTPPDLEQTDADDSGCFPPIGPNAIPVGRCIGTNGNFDGRPYQLNSWPSSETPSATVPTPITFSSPRTGDGTYAGDTTPYDAAALEADLPRIEANDVSGSNHCQRNMIDNNGNPVPGWGQGCLLMPLTDDQQTVATYPWFNTLTLAAPGTAGTCLWQLGNIPNSATTYDFNNQNANVQYGTLYPTTYLSGGATTPTTGTTGTIVRTQNYHNDLPPNTCGTVAQPGPGVPEAPMTWLLLGAGIPVALAVGYAARRRGHSAAAA